MTAGADLRLVRAAVFTAVCVTLSGAGHALTGGQPMPLWSLGAGFAVVFAVAAPLAGRERSLPGIAALLAAGQIALHTLFACERPASGGVSAPSAHAGAHGARLRELAARLLCEEESAGRISAARARQVVSDAGLGTGAAGPAGHAGHIEHAAHGGMAHHAEHMEHLGHAGNAGHDTAGSALAGAGTPLECLRSAAHAALSLFDGPMLLAHVLAALLLGWFLHRGEAALWRLVRLSARSARTAVRHVRAVLGALAAYLRALRGGRPLPEAPARARPLDTPGHGTARSVLLHHSVCRRGPPRGAQHESFALAA